MGAAAWPVLLHNFLSSQPDLNFHNADVQAAQLGNVEFWLDRGVDGFRLDAINFCFNDAQLRDNPPKPAELRRGRGFSPDNPYAFQYHHFNNTRPENLGFLEDLRTMLDRYPDIGALGEISSEDSLSTTAEYCNDRRLHMGYSFELLTEDCSAAYIRATVEALEARMTEGWPCWAISNHDVQRAVTRWGGANASDALAAQLVALVCSLRGSVCLYQGEELGLPEADVPFEALQDPYGKAFWPSFKGRDGCRTPMPWDASDHAGFSDAAPWLPVPASHLERNVSVQDAHPASVLNAVRAFLRWRKTQQALVTGSIRFLDAPASVLAFVREQDGQRLLVAFNLSADRVSWQSPAIATMLDAPGVAAAVVGDAGLELPPHGVAYAVLA